MLSRFLNENAIQAAILVQHLTHACHVIFAGYHYMSGPAFDTCLSCYIGWLSLYEWRI